MSPFAAREAAPVVGSDECSRCGHTFDADHLDTRRRCDDCAAEVAAELADTTAVNHCPHCTARRQCARCFVRDTEAHDHDSRCGCVLCARLAHAEGELELAAMDRFERTQRATAGSEVSL